VAAASGSDVEDWVDEDEEELAESASKGLLSGLGGGFVGYGDSQGEASRYQSLIGTPTRRSRRIL
jgi:hypothetical protein